MAAKKKATPKMKGAGVQGAQFRFRDAGGQLQQGFRSGTSSGSTYQPVTPQGVGGGSQEQYADTKKKAKKRGK